MGFRGNCTWIGAEIPLSSEFFRVIKNELWLFLIPAVLALLLLALFLEELGFFLRHVPSSRRRRLYLWILGMYPAFGLTSIIALYIPRSSSLCNFIAALYHSITLLKFMGLITDFFGGKSRMLEVLAGDEVHPSPFPCCCCCCLPMIAISRTSLGWMMAAVLQLSVVRTFLFFITLVLWTDEQYDYGDVDSVNPNMYVNAIIGVSTFLSFYGYLLFYKATKSVLHSHGLRAKFVCIVVVLVLCGLQSGILETMGAVNVVPCTPPFSALMRSQLIYHYCVIVEMFCISLFARSIFRKVEPSYEDGSSSSIGGGGEGNKRDDCFFRAQQEKSVQTQDDGKALPLSQQQLGSPAEEQWPGWCGGGGGGGGGRGRGRGSGGRRGSGGGASNPGYNSDSEDSLCRIEHAPLDRFPFPLPRRRESESVSARPSVTEDKPNFMASSRESPALELSKVTVTAEINDDQKPNVTVV